MTTHRLILRNRTRELISEVLTTYTIDQQRLFFGYETEQQVAYKLSRIEKGLSNTQVDYHIFDLVEKDSRVVVGSCGFHNWIKEHARSEIGYEIHLPYQGNGYIREAIKAVLRFGFSEMGLNRVEALVAPDNLRSIQILEKNGFIQEGILREHYKSGTSFEDSIVYSLLQADQPKP